MHAFHWVAVAMCPIFLFMTETHSFFMVGRVSHSFHLILHGILHLGLVHQAPLLDAVVVGIAVHVWEAGALSLLAPVTLVALGALFFSVAVLASQQASLFGTEVTSRTVLVSGGASAPALDTLVAILTPQAVFPLTTGLRVIVFLASPRLAALDARTFSIWGAFFAPTWDHL